MKNFVVGFSLVCTGALTLAIAKGGEINSQEKEAPQKESWQKIVDELVQPYLDSELVVGLSMGVIQGDRQEHFHYGSVDLSKQEVPNEQTIYEIGSISKVFTGILLAESAARGDVRLEDSLTDLIASKHSEPHRSQASIQLKHLVTHTSGLPRMPSNFQPENPGDPYVDYTSDKLFDFLSHHKLTAQPGEKWEYSNLGFGLLGQLLADRSGADYQQLLIERIAKPLSMLDTTIEISPERLTRAATPYTADLQATERWNFAAMAGAGAIRSTLHDMLHFARAHLSSPPESLADVLELAFQIHQESMGADCFSTGLGWLVARDGDTRFHNGQTGGFHSAIFLNRKLNQAVVILSNTATDRVDHLAEDLFRKIAGQSPAERQFPERIRVSKESMVPLVGKYQLIPGVYFSVEIVDDKLMVGLTGQPSLRVYPKSETHWFYRVVDASLTFEVGEDGSCNAVTLLQNGIEQKATRVP